MPGHWYEVKPKKLKASRNAEEWLFAYYLEMPYQSVDGEVFRAYLFRDKNREVFGAAVFRGDTKPEFEPREWATKVVLDEKFRERFRTNDEQLIALWKHH